MAKTDPTPMTDEQLAELLEERGHTGSATALRQKLTAERAVRANMPPPPPDEEISRSSSRARIERGYALGEDGMTIRRKRRNQPSTDGGHDGE